MRRVESKKRCLRCVDLPDESQGKWYTKKPRTRYTEPLKKFISPGGVYKKCMKKMIYHKAMVVHHGKDMLMKSREDDANNDIGCLLTSADYMERFQALPNGELQSEGFGKDESLSIEGRAVNYRPSERQRQIDEVLRGERLPPQFNAAATAATENDADSTNKAATSATGNYADDDTNEAAAAATGNDASGERDKRMRPKRGNQRQKRELMPSFHRSQMRRFRTAEPPRQILSICSTTSSDKRSSILLFSIESWTTSTAVLANTEVGPSSTNLHYFRPSFKLPSIERSRHLGMASLQLMPKMEWTRPTFETSSSE